MQRPRLDSGLEERSAARRRAARTPASSPRTARSARDRWAGRRARRTPGQVLRQIAGAVETDDRDHATCERAPSRSRRPRPRLPLVRAARSPCRAGGSPPGAAAAPGPARYPARRRSARARPGTRRAPPPAVRCGRAPASAAGETSRAADARGRAPPARRRRRRGGRARDRHRCAPRARRDAAPPAVGSRALREALERELRERGAAPQAEARSRAGRAAPRAPRAARARSCDSNRSRVELLGSDPRARSQAPASRAPRVRARA